jgi:CRISPR/Cas system Type II protein with McrA/HNH and RuvC-like nuclease domain
LVDIAAPHGPVSTDTVLCLLEHQHYRCALTGRRLTSHTAALDHIVPMRRGGKHAIENTQVLHKDVNRAKGSLTSEEFLGMCREVVRWADTAREKLPTSDGSAEKKAVAGRGDIRPPRNTCGTTPHGIPTL